MEILNGKITGGTLTADEWNQLPTEVQNIITDTNQVPASGDLNQLGKGIAVYAANGDFYIDSGAVNSYALTTVNSKQPFLAYTDGSRVRFRPGNSNTAASTANISSLGVKSIKDQDGDDLTAGVLVVGQVAELVFDLANDYFVFVTESITPGFLTLAVNGGCTIQTAGGGGVQTTPTQGNIPMWLGSVENRSAGVITAKNGSSLVSRSKASFFLDGVSTSAGATNAVAAIHRSHGFNARRINGDALSISVNVLHNVGINVDYTIVVSEPTVFSNFTTTTIRHTSPVQSVASGVVTSLTFTIPATGAIANGLQISAQASVGIITNKDFEWGELMVSNTLQPLPFNEASYETTFSECAKYYQKGAGGIEGRFHGDIASGVAYLYVTNFTQEMVSNPVITNTALVNTGFPAGNSALINSNERGFILQKLANVTQAGGTFYDSWTADARL